MQVCTSSQTTTPTSHHSVFYRQDALPAAQPSVRAVAPVGYMPSPSACRAVDRTSATAYLLQPATLYDYSMHAVQNTALTLTIRSMTSPRQWATARTDVVSQVKQRVVKKCLERIQQAYYCIIDYNSRYISSSRHRKGSNSQLTTSFTCLLKAYTVQAYTSFSVLGIGHWSRFRGHLLDTLWSGSQLVSGHRHF